MSGNGAEPFRIYLTKLILVCISGVGVEDDAVDAEVIADLQNRIKETQKDIEVSLEVPHIR